MKQLCTFMILLLLHTTGGAQNLLPAINSGIVPANTDPICPITYYNNLNYDSTGYLVGDTVNEFTLFDMNGDTFELSASLAQNKPVLLIAGSLTCPVFRSQLALINAVVSAYSAQLTTAVVYTVEAHPTDPSPYSGDVNVTSYNINDGVIHAQPSTFQERRDLVDTLLSTYSLQFPVYIDGPCNEWWYTYGPAPVNAYLINTSGIVQLKHGWFNQFPHHIFCELDSILNVTSGNCNVSNTTGSFIFAPAQTVQWGAAGTTIYTTGDIINNSANDVLVEVVKTSEVYAAGWNSAFCMNICYSPNTDSTTVLIPAGDTLHFSLDFFTSSTPDSSRVRVGFKNANAPNNQDQQWFRAYTTPTAITEQAPGEQALLIYPNPAAERIEIRSSDSSQAAQFLIYDAQGRIVHSEQRPSGASPFYVDISALPSGIYFLEIQSENGTSVQKFIRQ